MKPVVFTRSTLLAVAVTIASFSSATAADLAVPGSYSTLQAAVAAANPGDRILVANGTYALGGTLHVLESITIEGESRAGVIIDASSNAGSWGVRVSADDATLKNFTIIPPTVPALRGTGGGGGFAIHAAYDTATATPHANLTLQDITIDDSNRTAFDIHGYDGVTLSGLTATDAAYGNGIQLSGCTDVTINGCTTSGNAWGGIAVYASKSGNLGRPSSGISFEFADNSVAEYFYVEEEQGFASTAAVTGNTYQIDNDYSPPAASMTFYTDGDLAKATALAQGLNTKYSNSASVLSDASGAKLVVPGLNIQAAIDAASPGETLALSGAITLTSPINLDKQLTLDGGDKETTSISGSNALAGRFITILGAADNSIIRNISFVKTDKAGPQNLIGLQSPNVLVEDCDFSGQYVLGDPDVSRAFEISTSGAGFKIQNCSVTGLRQPGYINAVSSGQILDNFVAGSRGWVVDGGVVDFTGNTWGEGPEANFADIALLNGTPGHALYDPISSLSARNSGARIDNQRAGVRVMNTTQSTFHATIQAAVDAAVAGDAVEVYPGTYNEDVQVTKDVTLQGAGAGRSTISGPIGGGGATVQVSASGATVDGFTITRAGNSPADWNNGGLNFAGVAIQGQAVTGVQISNNELFGNRTGIDINNSNGHTVRNNVIANNRTGLIFRNQTDNLTVVENAITGNWTVGIVFLDASNGTNVPVQQAVGSQYNNNDLSGNWYGAIVDRQAGGALPAAGTFKKNFGSNWFGSVTPVVSTAGSGEPGYSAQIPVAFGGTATAPGGQPDIAGAASASIDFSPLLAGGTDTDVETAAGRGTHGFQGNTSETVDVVIGDTTVSTPQIHENLFIPGGTTVTVPAGTSLTVENLDMGPGSTLVVNEGSLTIGDSTISGSFTIFNSFGSFNIDDDTTFTVGQSLALVTDIHVAAGKTITVNGGGELILDGCVIDSQTPGSGYNIIVASDGLLTIARSVMADASVDVNTVSAAVPADLKSKVYDNSFTNSDIEASADAAVYHNLFDAATAGTANTDSTVAFDPVDGWGNVTDANDLLNRFTLGFAAPGDTTRTLDSDGNLFVQPADPVVLKVEVGNLSPHTIVAAEALLGYNSDRLALTGGGSSPAAGWDVIVEEASVASSLGLIDSTLGLELTGPGDDGVSGPATIADLNFTAGTPGLSLGFFRVQTDRNFSGGELVKDTRLTKSTGGVTSYLRPFTANTGELVIDDEAPTVSTSGVTGTQIQPSAGSVDILQPGLNYVIRDGVTPVILTFTATDAGLAGLDAADAAADLTLVASNGTTTLNSGDYTVAASETAGVVTYEVTLNVPADATTGLYTLAASVIDRSGVSSLSTGLGSFSIANEAIASIELQAFAGGTRAVTFVATDGAGVFLGSWTKTVTNFSGGIGSVVLENVPAGTSAISAKSAWTLRNKRAVSFSPEGVGSLDLTGTTYKLKGGDLNGDNVINTLDYGVLRFHFNSTVPASRMVADITGDVAGEVNLTDFNVMQANFYTVGSAQ